MPIDNYNLTTSVLGLLDNLAQSRYRTKELEEDRSFKFAMESWYQKAQEKAEKNKMLLQASLSERQSKLTQIGDAEKKLAELGVLSGKVSQTAQRPLLDIAQQTGSQVDRLSKDVDEIDNTAANIVGETSKLEMDLQNLYKTASDYQAGLNDADMATFLSGFAGATSKQGILKWTVDPQEVAKGVGTALQDPAMKAKLEPYLDKEGRLDTSKPITKGLMSRLAGEGQFRTEQEIKLMNAVAGQTQAAASLLAAQLQAGELPFGEKLRQTMEMQEAKTYSENLAKVKPLKDFAAVMFESFAKLGPSDSVIGVLGDKLKLIAGQMGDPKFSARAAYDAQLEGQVTRMSRWMSDTGNVAVKERSQFKKMLAITGKDSRSEAYQKATLFKEIIDSMETGNIDAITDIFDRNGVKYKITGPPRIQKPTLEGAIDLLGQTGELGINDANKNAIFGRRGW